MLQGGERVQYIEEGQENSTLGNLKVLRNNQKPTDSESTKCVKISLFKS